MEFYNTYVNLETGKNVSMNEVIEFVEYVAKTFNPSAPYNNDITASAFRRGSWQLTAVTIISAFWAVLS